MYDAIVIGARCAGSPTAMLLAKKGYRVLLLDRAHFPSDTLSTHQVQVPGGAALRRWGLLDAVVELNCPPARQVSFSFGSIQFSGRLPAFQGVDAIHSPRRRILDKILVDAAVESGAELREDVIVESLILEENRVVGIRGRKKSDRGGDGVEIEEHARVVIGADGKHSLVAQQVQAKEYHLKPISTCAYYTYWEGLHLQGGEMYNLDQHALGIWPTNDGLAMIYTGYPLKEFPNIRGDIEGRFWKTMDAVPQMHDRLHAGRQAERFYGSADLPAFYRVPFGPGWALVGDAGMCMDPISGRGIGNAFIDSERLAGALDAVFSGSQPFETALGEWQRQRDAETLPMYEFTSQLTSFAPPTVEQQALLSALVHKPEAATQFFGVLTGVVPVPAFFAPSNLLRVIGLRGMARILLNRRNMPQIQEAHA